MMSQEVCVLTGKTGAKEYSMLEKYASVGCIIAFMDTTKELGRLIKEELERLYNVTVFFFQVATGSKMVIGWESSTTSPRMVT